MGFGAALDDGGSRGGKADGSAPSIAGAAAIVTLPLVCPADTVHWPHSSISDGSSVALEPATTA